MSHSSLRTPSSQAATKPFAMLPHNFVSDPRLSASDVQVILALLFWARDKSYCWPCAASIGERINKKERAARMALKNLEHFGYVRFEKDSHNKTGRRIILVWREDGKIAETKEGDSPRKRHKDRSKFAATTDGDRCFRTDKREAVSSSCEATLDHQEAHHHPSDLEITSFPLSDTEGVDDDSISNDRKRSKVLAGLATLSERRGRGQVIGVARTAKLMASLFLDEESVNFYRLTCWRVAKGKVASQIVADAFVATYDKVVENQIESLGPYFVGCLRNKIADEALDEFALEFKEDRERAKTEYSCQDTNPIGEVA